MAKVSTQVRIDSNIKNSANELFASLGIDMSTAINIFLHQCILCDGLPFPVEKPRYSQELREAVDEAHRIARDPNVKGYSSMEELRSALLSDDAD
ncbi:MAG: type II toxin-antitoxin system RelB/DinJ family antitoxin [Clostridia bacterium]|nr:type II toxin-antitoxin system RelB/DinJ family antitoxin [Clostridia bacterium]